MKSALDKRWDKQYERLKAFVEAKGRLPFSTTERKDERPIATWINKQKKKYKQGLLTEEQAALLRDVGVPI